MHDSIGPPIFCVEHISCDVALFFFVKVVLNKRNECVLPSEYHLQFVMLDLSQQ